MRVALLCPVCGAPLPLAAASLSPASHVTCDYCRVVLRSQAGHLEVSAKATEPPREEDHAARRQAFTEAMKAVSLGEDPYRVLCDAAARHLGVLGESDAVARVTLALAADFEHESGARVTGDANALARIAEAYLRASVELRSMTRTEINLPFLAATSQGPKHLLRTVTAADLAALATGADRVATPAPAAITPEPDAPAKKWWWPF